MRDAYEHELRARLRDLEDERRDVSVLHDHETGDFPVLVESCERHGMYAPSSLIDRFCHACEAEWAEFYQPTNRTLPPVRRDK